jgi:hypothetical protein
MRAQRRKVTLAAGPSVVLIVILLQCASAAAGAVPTSGVRHVFYAPFHGYTTPPTISTRQSGCARNADLPGPSLNLTTGFGGLNLTSRATSCPKTGGNSTAEVSAYHIGNVLVPNRAGVTQVYANFTFSTDLRLLTHAGKCSPFASVSTYDCSTTSFFNLSLWAELIDTNTSYYYGSSGPSPGAYWGIYNQTYCNSGSCSGYSGGSGCIFFSAGCGSSTSDPYHLHLSGNASWSFALSSSMTPGHRYILWFHLNGETFDETYCNNATLVKAHTESSIDLLTGGDGFKLVSIVEV